MRRRGRDGTGLLAALSSDKLSLVVVAAMFGVHSAMLWFKLRLGT